MNLIKNWNFMMSARRKTTIHDSADWHSCIQHCQFDANIGSRIPNPNELVHTFSHTNASCQLSFMETNIPTFQQISDSINKEKCII